MIVTLASSAAILAALAGLVVVIEPSAMRWLCARGLAHAEALESYRIARADNTRYWDNRFAGETQEARRG